MLTVAYFGGGALGDAPLPECKKCTILNNFKKFLGKAQHPPLWEGVHLQGASSASNLAPSELVTPAPFHTILNSPLNVDKATVRGPIPECMRSDREWLPREPESIPSRIVHHNSCCLATVATAVSTPHYKTHQ